MHFCQCVAKKETMRMGTLGRLEKEKDISRRRKPFHARKHSPVPTRIPATKVQLDCASAIAIPRSSSDLIHTESLKVPTYLYSWLRTTTNGRNHTAKETFPGGEETFSIKWFVLPVAISLLDQALMKLENRVIIFSEVHIEVAIIRNLCFF